MKKVVKTSVAVILLCLAVVSCSKENLVDENLLYNLEANDGKEEKPEDKPEN